MAKKIGPEARIISLFTTLSDDSKRIVLDVIKSQSPARPKASSTAQPAGRKSSRKGGATSPTASAETAREGVSDAPKCAICGNFEAADNHNSGSPDYHIFRTSLKKSN
jgi:hypothetical protein